MEVSLMKVGLSLTMIMVLVMASISFAGGWDKSKGLDKVTVEGEFICIGCNLKKLSGANAQCSLYAQHAIGFRTRDGVMWNIVENEKGHDIIRAHTVLEKGVKGKITGWLYPIANMIEIDSVEVDGIGIKEIQKAAWEEDQKIAGILKNRKQGEAPIQGEQH
jgi:hypothetical protein